jgi:hypothetical protein
MAHYATHRCKICEQVTEKELLFAKMSSFRSLATGKVIKSRTLY